MIEHGNIDVMLADMIRAVTVAQEVAHRTTETEVLSLIPTGSWAFIFSSLSNLSQSVLRP